MSENNTKEKKRKTFVLDTNVLIHDPRAFEEFKNSKVVLPIKVIEELDKFKSYNDDKGRNVREVIRQIDKLRDKGKLYQGVKLPNGGLLQIVLNYLPDTMTDISMEYEDVPEPELMDTGIADNEIILTALKLLKERKGPVTFVSKDLNSRIKAATLGIDVEDYKKMKVVVEDLHKGYVNAYVSKDQIDCMFSGKDVQISEIQGIETQGMLTNTFIGMTDVSNEKHKGMGRYIKSRGVVIPVHEIQKDVGGITPRNIEQKFAFDLLLDDKIQLVTLVGQAGTGKTLLALASALQKTMDEQAFDKIVVSRPIIPMGKDIGYLPGTKDDKIHLWMQPIFDNLKFIFKRKRELEGKDGVIEDPEKEINYIMDKGTIELEALTYIRGRSLPNQFLIIDEAQNLTPHEVKTIISRAGEGTKVVLTGDPYQIDNPYLDASSNGLIYAIDKFKDQEIHGHITLSKSERSTLASLAADLL